MEKIGIRLAIVMLLLLLGSDRPARATDLMEVYRMAVAADPAFIAAGYTHQASQETRIQANSGYLPALVGSYDWSGTRQEIIESDNALFQRGAAEYSTHSALLSLVQPLFRYASYVRIQQSKVEVLQADAEFEEARQNLLMRSAENYLNALAAEDQLDFIRAERSAVERQLLLAKAKEKALLGRRSDLLEAQARLASVAADFSEAEVNRRDAYEAIYELTGEIPTSLKKLQNEFPLVAPDPPDVVGYWVEAALQQNWEIQVQRHAVEVQRQEVSRQNAGHFPTVDLELRESYKNSGGTMFGGGSEVQNTEVFVNFKLPLYLGGSINSKKRQALFEYKAEQSELVRISRKVRRETEKGYSAIVNAIQRVKAREMEVDAQSEVLKLKRAGYQASLYTNLSVLDAERDLYSGKRHLARARYEYLLNSLKLRSIVGVLAEEDLVSLNQWLN